jgi:hypothetical protein
MARSVIGHWIAAQEIYSIESAPKTVQYKRSLAAPVRVDMSNRRLAYALDVFRCAEEAHMRKGGSGWLIPYLSGARWETVPERLQGKLAADIRNFKKGLRDGGYRVG